VLLVRSGQIDREILQLILSNVRTPEEREGDLLAQWMAIRRGEARLLEAVGRFGVTRVLRNMHALQNYTERMMRAVLAKLPDGAYSFDDFLDNDGISEKPVRISVAVTISRDSAVVDFTGSAPQTAGPVNANYAITLAATTYVFRCLLSEDVPFTSGLMRPLTVVAPEGTVVNARPPAAMAAGNVETSQRITDVLLGALSRAAPHRIPAASSGTMNNVSFGGWDPLRNRPFAYYETIAGGMGASPRACGLSAVHTHMTNSWNTPIEALEHQYPIRVKSYRIRAATGGKGRQRGGDGIVRQLEFLTDCDITLLTDRRRRAPYGLNGGAPGKPGRNSLLRGNRRIALAAKTTLTARPGDVLRIETPGGGGFGRAGLETPDKPPQARRTTGPEPFSK
jgi:N-methylhydantoinase B/oxoprolinase/acetone carboxylase alpha subunit